MAWQITSYPALSVGEKQNKLDWIASHYQEYEQAKSDTYKYGPLAAFGDSSALARYSQALATIEGIKEEFRDIRLSQEVWNDGTTSVVVPYNHYLTESPYLESFTRVGNGSEDDDVDTIDEDRRFYTFDYKGGSDTVSIGEGGRGAYINLGQGSDTFNSGDGYGYVYGGSGNDVLIGGSKIDVLDGGDGVDMLVGGSSIDILYGGKGVDMLEGGEGGDFIDGGTGNDLINGGEGDDFINGGTGVDTSQYSGKSTEYSLTINDDGSLIVEDLDEDRDGTDLLVNVETLIFADNEINTFSIPGAPNLAPVELSLSSFSFDENIAPGSALATLSTSDPDSGDTHTYALVSGDGDSDNSAFTIEGDLLKIIESPDFESKSSYSIRLQTTDSGGMAYEKEVTLNMNNINEEPVDVSVSAFTFDENIENDSVVATLNTLDPDFGDTHTYKLISGQGYFDNGSSSTSGSGYFDNGAGSTSGSGYFDNGSGSSSGSGYYDNGSGSSSGSGYFDNGSGSTSGSGYFDNGSGSTSGSGYFDNGSGSTSGSGYFENGSGSTSGSGYFDNGAGSTSGSGYFDNGSGSTSGSGYFDNGSGSTTGSGYYDNSAFTIEGNQLKIIKSPDFEEKSSYTIRVQTKDSGGLTLEKEFTLNVSDVNEEPADISMSASSFDENILGGSAVATLSTSDPDTGDTHTYSLVSGDGDADNSAFIIDGNQLKIVESPDFETKPTYSIRLETKDADGLALEKVVTHNVIDVNEKPLDVSVSASSFDENIPGGSAVATLSTSDPDLGDTYAYALVSGDGDTDNSAFIIDGNQLKIVESPDFKTKPTYSIRLETKDADGLALEKVVTLNVIDVNEKPLDVSVSASSFDENILGGSAVATLSTSDPDLGDTYAYALVSGDGDTDNSAFTIEGDQLKIVESPDFETKSSYSIRLETKDADGLSLEREVTLNVSDVNEEPLDVSVSASSFDENIAAGSAVATLSTSDPDLGDTYAYALVSGDGDTDNSAFTIEGDQLKIVESPDFETKSSYSIRLETKDSGGLALEKVVTLNVIDVNEKPVAVSVSTSSFDENIATGSAVATLSTSDPDTGDTHTYALVSGVGDDDNSAFTIEGNQLKIAESPDFETKSSYSIRLETKDADGLSLEREVTLNVSDVNEEPAAVSVSASSFDENIAVGSAVATLSTSDPDTGDTHTYALVSGVGDADNSAFTIEGNQLKIAESPDFETKSSYSIRLETKDSGGLIIEKAFNLQISPTIEWTRLLGSSTDDYGYSVSTATDGSVYIAGITQGNLDAQFNRGGNDGFLSKYNSDGSRAWTQLLGSSSSDYVKSVNTAADGSVYITGYTLGNLDGKTNNGNFDAFLSKYNEEGSREWTQLLGSTTSDLSYSVSTAADGSVYITGSTLGNLDGQANSGISDAFLTKYNDDGSKVWTKLLGSSHSDFANSIATAPDGSIFIAGVTYSQLDGQAYNGGIDAFLSKYSQDGSKQWTRLLGSSVRDVFYSISTDLEGSIYLAGYTEGDLDDQRHSGATFDALLSKYNSDGSKEWTRLLGSSSDDYGLAVSAASDGSVYIAGSTEGNLDGETNIGGWDTFLSKYYGDGSKVWTQMFGSSSYDTLSSISTAVDGSVYLAGSTKGNLDDQANVGGSDAFLAKYKSIDGINTDSSSFQIKDVEHYSHGLSLVLTDAPDMNAFALYSGVKSSDEELILILTDSSDEEVNLSAHWEDQANQLHLLSNQILEEGDYTLKIRADGLVSQSGDLLDGNGDGVDGDDYIHSFTHVTPDHFISVGDTARSAGQDLSTNGKDLKDGITGIPIHLSTTSSLQSVSGEISYDSDLLKGVSLVKGSDLPSDWVVNYSESSPGTLDFTVSGESVATGSIEDTLRLMGQVDANASDSYGSTSLIQATITDSSEGQIAFKSDPGLLVNAYSGDTTGNGTHSSLDASRVQRVVVGLDSGFDAFDDINPVLIGDTTGNGSLSSLDASRIQQEVVGLPVDTFPSIPLA